MADNIMNPQPESYPNHFTWRWLGGNPSLPNRRCSGPLTPSSPPTLLSNAQRTLTSKLLSPWHLSMNAYIHEHNFDLTWNILDININTHKESIEIPFTVPLSRIILTENCRNVICFLLPEL